MPKVLIVDDDDEVRTLAADMFIAHGMTVATARDGLEGIERVAADVPDVVVLDVDMPRLDGLATLRRLRATHPDLAVIMVTAFADVATAVSAMQLGAYDFVIKPLMMEDFVATVGRAMERTVLRGQVEDLRRHVSTLESFGDLMGASEASRGIADQVRRIAPTPLTVVVSGETGTGKEVVARALHRGSLRADGPLVAVDCGAMPDTLMESALFGHERGAFTGADRRKDGYFQLARGGTLFLDEIGNLPLGPQAKLLRALQERCVLPLGAARPVDVDVRVIAASNANLREEVRAGRFREDLYYRLAEYVIALPPLRERRDDIPPLARRFLADMALELGRPGPEIGDEAMAVLVDYAWPGNIRELRNVVRRAALVATDVLRPGDLRLAAPDAPASTTTAHAGVSSPSSSSSMAPAGGRSLRAIATAAAEAAERQAIVATLHATGGNKSEAARLLHVDFKTLHLKMRRLRIPGRVLGPLTAAAHPE
ncbi:MAG: sigma-54-dependent Fis family transcriptional regulator [Candidatus Rokubacteria bacterium]|nr:sigma-54-dependent Fis family transcriptional regulator [Candidatus Rokubacteria bacterium]